MGSRRIWACAAVLLTLAAALAGLFVLRPPTVTTSLYGLVGPEAERIPRFVRDHSAKEMSVLVSAPSSERAEAEVKRLRARYGAANALPEGAVEFLRRERAGLVAPDTARLLQTPEGRAKVAKRALRRLYSSPLPPLLGFADDPFGLTDGYLATMARGRDTIVTNGLVHVLAKLRGDRLKPFDGAVVREENGLTVRFCGAPVHAAVAEAKCRREINALTIFSLVVIALLSLAVFRSVRWIPLLGCSLAVSALAGGLALCAAFSEIHILSLVFGTTVLGLVIDYSFHWLLASGETRGTTLKNLFVSCLTTEISLLPLMLSSVPVLRQAAVFLGTALAAALVFVLAAYPRHGGNPRPAVRVPRICPRLVCALAVCAALAGAFFLHVRTDVTALYRTPPELLENEKLRAAFGGPDLAVLPSLDQRRETQKNVLALYAEQGEALRRELGLATLTPPPDPTFAFVAPRTFIDKLLSGWTREALCRLAFALVCMLLTLACVYRRRALRVFAPSFFALTATAGLLSLGGVNLNLFHLLAFFLLAGVGVDYTVFLHSGAGTAFRSALCSLLTSLAGFGALAFVSLPVVASFGQVLGLGLPLAFLAALALAPQDETGVERAASPIGLEILLFCYRLFGLSALHALSALVGTSAWLFSRSVRKASPSLRKVVAFTQSLSDKLVVMADGRRPPKVVAEETPDLRAFVSDVRQGRGVFVLSCHVGTIETLAAYGPCERTVHAWMDVDRTGVFNGFYLRHAKRRRVVIHPISRFDMGSVFEAGDQLDDGDCVLMAGDRGEGAFHLAAAFGHPVYFAACLATGNCAYRLTVLRLPSDRAEMKAAYGRAVDALRTAHPEQDFTFA